MSDKSTAPLIPEPSPTPSKVVKFMCLNGVWSVEVDLNDTTAYFTDRDFNQLAMLLTVKRAGIKREAYVKYYRNQQAKNKQLPAKALSSVAALALTAPKGALK